MDTTSTTTTTTAPTTRARWTDEEHHIDMLLPDGVIAFGIMQRGKLNYGADPAPGLAPTAEDVSKLVNALGQNHVLTDAVMESKLGTVMRMQVVYPDDADTSAIAIVVHIHGHACAKSTTRFARRLMHRVCK